MEGNTIPEFDIVNSMVLGFDFLCISITLDYHSKDYYGKLAVNIAPYNKTNLYTFEFPKLTHGHSWVDTNTKLAAFKTMMLYGTTCSSQLASSIQFFESLVRQLYTNKYPEKVILRMWAEATTGHDSVLALAPCRESLHEHKHTLAVRIQQYIEKYRSNSRKKVFAYSKATRQGVED